MIANRPSKTHRGTTSAPGTNSSGGERFAIVLRAEPGWRGDVTARLRKLLKLALRACGLRCVEITPIPPDQSEAGSSRP